MQRLITAAKTVGLSERRVSHAVGREDFCRGEQSAGAAQGLRRSGPASLADRHAQARTGEATVRSVLAQALCTTAWAWRGAGWDEELFGKLLETPRA